MMKERVSKFDKFIKENEAKRRRAIQKYQTELRLKEQKTKEHEVNVKRKWAGYGRYRKKAIHNFQTE